MALKKALVFDSSSIISLAMNGLLGLLPKLKATSKVEFLITPQVKREVIDNPIKIKRFELEALMILGLIEDGTLEVVSDKNLEKETYAAIDAANAIYSSKGESIKILHSGESSLFAISRLLNGYDITLVIDERTARVLSENPENLRELLEKKLHREVEMDEEKASYFLGQKIIRSAELCLIAYRKGLIDLPASPKEAVDALLFGVKLNGCSISYEEIETAKRLFK